MRIVAVLSHKGGVGKTLTCANLAAGLTDLGMGVLLVDFDPQADLTASLGIDADDQGSAIEEILAGSALDAGCALRHIESASGDGSLALLPTVQERLRQHTAQLIAGGSRQLLDLLGPVADRFDVALIDTPAGDTVFGRQALVAADRVIVPLLPGFQELRALTRALDVLDEQAADSGIRVHLLGALLLNADARWRSTKEYGAHLAAMAERDELSLFETVIPRHQPVTDHARYGMPTIWLRPRSSVADAYRRLAREVVVRLAKNPEDLSAETDAFAVGDMR
jgi:chromosome partitioning protein